MNGRVKIQVYIKIETFNRIKSLRLIPPREWGEHRVPEYWGSLVDSYTETIEFQILEKESQIQRLKREVGIKDSVLKFKASEIERKTQEIQALKREIEALKRQIADMRGDTDDGKASA
jgi:hypothetical protein